MFAEFQLQLRVDQSPGVQIPERALTSFRSELTILTTAPHTNSNEDRQGKQKQPRAINPGYSGTMTVTTAHRSNQPNTAQEPYIQISFRPINEWSFLAPSKLLTDEFGGISLTGPETQPVRAPAQYPRTGSLCVAPTGRFSTV